MTISRRKLVGAAGLLPPFAAAFTLSSAVKASEPETSDAESCSVAVIGAGAAGLAAAIAAKEAGAVRARKNSTCWRPHDGEFRHAQCR